MKTVHDAFVLFRQELQDVYNITEVDSINMLVLSSLLNKSKAVLKAFPETELTYQQYEQLVSITQQLKTGCPVQYVLGHAEFYGLIFQVNPTVLIPRPETEELVQWIIDTARQKPIKNIIDIGTGSGCIAISLKKHLPEVNIYAIDVSDKALQVAKQNALNNNTKINFINTDILTYTGDDLPAMDIIVSNPPYVTETDKLQMHKNVTDFEPHTALFVPDNDPLIFYKSIADFAVKKLSSPGLLFLEINEGFGKQTVEIINNKLFKNIELRKDLSERDRMIKAEFA